jgi:protein-S-isoprenylcysteine O-methyltransferase
MIPTGPEPGLSAGVWLSPFPSRELALAFVALAAAWVASELFLGRSGLDARSIGSDRGSSFAIALAFAAGVMAALAASELGWAATGEAWPRWLGLSGMAAGLALRVYSIVWLGPMFTRFVQILPGHKLVKTGPYRFVRHPSYSGLLLFFAGMGLALGSWLSLAALVGLPAVGIAYRIRVEERALLGAFGEEYRACMGEVRRLVPFVL